MTRPEYDICTQRLRLRPWRDSDLDAFADLHADPEVMADLGGPETREQSAQKFQRYVTAYRAHGYSRFCVETLVGQFIGYVGVFPRQLDHSIGRHDEIGWRLARSTWGQGYATEAARAALADAFERHGLSEILSYTAPDNIRSQKVMARLGLQRAPERDFVWDDGEHTPEQVWVWVAQKG